AALAAHELGDVGVFLLRHDRAAGRNLVGKLDEPKFRRRPKRQVGAEAREVDEENGCGGEKLGDEVAIRHGVDRILRDSVKPELTRDEDAIDRIGYAGERTR